MHMRAMGTSTSIITDWVVGGEWGVVGETERPREAETSRGRYPQLPTLHPPPLYSTNSTVTGFVINPASTPRWRNRRTA